MTIAPPRSIPNIGLVRGLGLLAAAAVVPAVAGISDHLRIPDPYPRKAGDRRWEDCHDRPDVAAIVCLVEMFDARLKDLFLGREVAHVPQLKALPVQSPDATIAVPPRDPRAMGQLVLRLPVGTRSIDLATHDLESAC